MNTKETTPKQIIIIGGGYAGTLAALRLAGKTKQTAVTITLVNGLDVFVERIRLHQLASNQPLPHRPFSKLLANSGVNFVQGWVTAVSPSQSTIHIHTPSGETQMAYDYLIYALGSSVATDTIPGIEEHAMTLGSTGAAKRLQQALPKIAETTPHKRGGRLLIIGGGLTGIEAATEIAEAHPQLQISLATKGIFGSDLSPRGANYIRQTFQQLGITLLENAEISHIDAQSAYAKDGQKLPFDVCLWAGPFSVPALARESGLAVDVNGRLHVTPTLQHQTHPNIYACGDAAATPLRMACATAMPMAAYIADHLAARIQNNNNSAPFRFAYAIRCISLGRKKGIVQLVTANDQPKDKIITGWLGAAIKETICRFTIWALQFEKRLPGSYRWPKADIMGTKHEAETYEPIHTNI